MAAKVSRPVLYGGVLVLAIAGFVMTSSPPPSGSSSASAKAKKKTTTVVEQFTKEDYEKPFESLNEQPKNAFMPLVARNDGPGGGLAPNEIPASYTGGEAGWTYTGTVFVNDVPSALIENSVTGEAFYLKVGERVKRAVIAQIAPTYIVVNGAAGQSLRLDLLRDLPEPGEELEAMGIEPVRPDVPGALQGPIGGPVRTGGPNQRTTGQP